ncbi:MAG: hypothetical protein ACR2PO_20710 [Methyloligellaceae bacterium]
MSDEQQNYGMRPEVEAAWNFPLFDALTGRRSRRFGFGMELTHGPFTYKSDKEPYPLSEDETAMLVAAATGVTGAILCEGDTQGGMVKSVGRTHPSAVGAHRTQLFFTNDDGLYLYQGTKHKMSKMKEYETPEDRDKIKGFYDEYTVKLSDGRFDLPRAEPGLYAHNHWVTNKPGATLFMPVTDISQDLIRLMINMVDTKGGARYTKGGGYYICDDRRGMRPAGCEKWADNGLLDKSKILPLGRLEKIIVSWLCAEGAMMGQLMQLAMAAMGLGGWMHGGFTPHVVMGGTPVCKGLGFRHVTSKDDDPLPNPVGLDGYFEGFCPPYYKDMDAAVDAAVAGMGEKLDEWERRGMTLPHTVSNEEFEKAVPGLSDEGIECTKDICRYIYEEYGKFPAHNDTMHLLYFIQVHHLDTDFYDKYFKKGAYLDTHKNHFEMWHKGSNIPRRNV